MFGFRSKLRSAERSRRYIYSCVQCYGLFGRLLSPADCAGRDISVPYHDDRTLFGLSESVIIPSGFPPGDTYTWIATRLTIKSTPPFLIFEYGDLTNGNASRPFTCESSADRSCGQLTFVPVATPTPEPTSLALVLSGIGLLFAMRKRSFGLR